MRGRTGDHGLQCIFLYDPVAAIELSIGQAVFDQFWHHWHCFRTAGIECYQAGIHAQFAATFPRAFAPGIQQQSAVGFDFECGLSIDIDIFVGPDV